MHRHTNVLLALVAIGLFLNLLKASIPAALASGVPGQWECQSRLQTSISKVADRMNELESTTVVMAHGGGGMVSACYQSPSR